MGVDTVQIPVMVSVLADNLKRVDVVADYLESTGYKRRKQWKRQMCSIEIVGGYLAHLRGQNDSRGGVAYVFHAYPRIALVDRCPILERDGVTVAFTWWRDEEFGVLGGQLTAIQKSTAKLFFGKQQLQLLLQHKRIVLHLLGPADRVRSETSRLAQHPAIDSAIATDLQAALTWWEQPRLLPNAPEVWIAAL